MRNQSILATLLALPLLLLACDRAEQSPTTAAPAADKQVMTPSSQDRMLDRAPPAAGMPASPDAATPAMPPAAEPANAPAADEPKKAY
jgi:hypothetical protein